MDNEKDLKTNDMDNNDMGFFNIISDGRTNSSTKLFRLVKLTFDLIFILLIGFGILFFYLGSQVGWIFTILAIIRYLTKNG